MYSRLCLFLIVSLMVSACQSTTSSKLSDTSDHRGALEAQSRALTHKIITTEATFDKPLNGLLPNGISRMTADELKQTSVSVEDKSISAEEFLKARDVESLIAMLGEPVRRDFVSSRYIVLSYNGSNYSYIAFVCNEEKALLKVVGYKNVHEW